MRSFSLSSTLLVLSCSLPFLNACDDSDQPEVSGTGGASEVDAGPDPDASEPNEDISRWTVLVYGQADSNISADFVDNIQEMNKAAIAEDVTVIVAVDWNASLPNIHDPSCKGKDEEQCPLLETGTKWLRIRGNGTEPEVIKEADEQNSTDPVVLRETVRDVFVDYPAENRAVILWNHGGSWDGGYGTDVADGTLEDGTGMTHVEAIAAVREGAQGDDPEALRPLSLFAFDTCLMGSVEVAYEARELATLYIANAELDYGAGMNYRDLFELMSDESSMDLRKLGAAEVAGWKARHESQGLGDKLMRSHVAIDLTKMEALAGAIELLVSSALEARGSSMVEMARDAYLTRPAYSAELKDGELSESYRDLGQFLVALAGDDDETLANAASVALSALDEAIIANDQGDLRVAAGQYGLHVALPLPVYIDNDLLESYADLAAGWSGATGWRTLLSELADESEAMPEVDTLLSNGTSPDADNLPTVEATPSEFAAELTYELTLDDDDGNRVHFGVFATQMVSSQADLGASWNLTVPVLPDGEGGTQTVTATRFIPEGLDGGLGLILLVGECDYGDGDVAGCDLIARTDTAEVIALLDRYEADQPVIHDIETTHIKFPGLRFAPQVKRSDAAGNPLESVMGVPFQLFDGAALMLSYAPAEAGEYTVVTTVYDAFGQTASTSDAVIY